jgi:hypothetical protein
MSDWVVAQLVEDLVEQLDVCVSQGLLVDRLIDLGAEEEAEWVRALDVARVARIAFEDGEGHGAHFDPEEYGDLTWWDWVRGHVGVEDLSEHLGIAIPGRPGGFAALQSSVSWQVVRGVYLSASQEGALEARLRYERGERNIEDLDMLPERWERGMDD